MELEDYFPTTIVLKFLTTNWTKLQGMLATMYDRFLKFNCICLNWYYRKTYDPEYEWLLVFQELYDELPTLFDQRIPHIAAHLQHLFAAESTVMAESSKVT